MGRGPERGNWLADYRKPQTCNGQRKERAWPMTWARILLLLALVAWAAWTIVEFALPLVRP